MSLTTWLIVLASTAVGLVVFRAGFRFGYQDFAKISGPDWESVAFGVTVGLIALLVAPVVLLGLIVRRVTPGKDPATFARIVGGESRATKVKRLEREARDREQRIRELEHELL